MPDHDSPFYIWQPASARPALRRNGVGRTIGTGARAQGRPLGLLGGASAAQVAPDPTDRHVEGVVDTLRDANSRVDAPPTAERLFADPLVRGVLLKTEGGGRSTAYVLAGGTSV